MVTCVVGATDDNDPKSGICFYRTHYGHSGNLIEKLLEQRSPLKKDITLQGDMASWNKASEKYYAIFNITFAGCASHARRPFNIHSDDDNGLCDQMLFYFLLLTKMEKRIDERGRTVARVLFYRKHYGQKIWDKILELCESVINAKKLSECSDHYVWPASSKFGVACRYIKKHFKELTVYLSFAKISPDNNKVERLLRPEKLYLNNSKRKETEWAKTCSDILRTILMTCQFAEVPFEEYLIFSYKNRDKMNEDPSLFTPYAFSKIRAEEKIRKNEAAV
jgi:Transposase IS66 family